MRVQFVRVVIVFLILTFSGSSSFAAKLGLEFSVNTFKSGPQLFPSVAGLSGGGFVVTWASELQDGSSWGIYGQRYNTAGKPKGSEFRVNSLTAGTQLSPSVSGLSNGGFVVTWSSDQDGSGSGIYGQRYNAVGRPRGPNFRVNTYTANNQLSASVSGLPNGGFAITWASLLQDGSGYGTYGQRYDAAGNRLGIEFRVNTFTAQHQDQPQIAVLSGGSFVVTWQSYLQDGSGWGIYGQRYNAAGNRVGGEFRVNRNATNGQLFPNVAGLSGGGFVVTWYSEDQDGSGYGIYGQLYDAAGSRLGRDFRVNTYTESLQFFATVSGLSGGGYVVTWASLLQDGSGYGIYGQRYDATGNRLGSEFRVNTYTSNHQFRPSVAGLSGGGFVAIWESEDGSDRGIFGQRYGELLSHFPLRNQDPWTAAVTSIFDHTMRNSRRSEEILPYSVEGECDGLVQAFSGDVGNKKNGSDNPTSCSIRGYFKDAAKTQVWDLDGINYVGTSGGKVLNYEGHPGIDYRTGRNPRYVYSAAAGIIRYPRKIVGSQDAFHKFHTLALIPNVDTSYRIYYMHLSTHPSPSGETVDFPIVPQPGCYKDRNGVEFTPTELPLPSRTRVGGGCLIALSGEAGVEGSPHLHFEVQRIYPADQVKSTVGTYVQCWTEGAKPTQDPNRICLPLDPYGWSNQIKKVTDCTDADPRNWRGDTYACLSGFSSEDLWR